MCEYIFGEKRHVMLRAENNHIYMYGTIGWEITAEDVLQALSDIEKRYSECIIHMHTVGGSVMDGVAIFNMIKQSRIRITISVDGMAASMGAIILMAADRVKAANNAMIMIHAASGWTDGGIAAHESSIKLLKNIGKSFMDEMRRKTNLTEKQIKEYMDGTDHWLSAEEAQQIGLVDEIYDAAVETERFALPTDMVSAKTVAMRFSAALETQFQSHFNKENMALQKESYVALGLTEGASEHDVADKISAMAASVRELTEQLGKAQSTIKELTAAAEKKEKEIIESLVDAAVKNRSIDASKREKYIALGGSVGSAALEEILADIAPAPRVSSLIKRGRSSAADDGRKWDDMTNAELRELRENDREAYDALYNEKYGEFLKNKR